MFFRRKTCEWLEPMGKMGYAFTFCPCTKTVSYLVAHGPVYLFSAPGRCEETFICVITEVFPGSIQGKYIFIKNTGDPGSAFYKVFFRLFADIFNGMEA